MNIRELFEPLSSQKKGTGKVMSYIHRDMQNSSLGDIFKMSENEDPDFPSFIRWRISFYDDIDAILALDAGTDSETTFFKSFLKDDTRVLLAQFTERFLEKFQKNNI